MTQPQAGNSTASGARRRVRAALAVLAGAALLAGGYLAAEYRSEPGQSLAAVPGPAPDSAGAGIQSPAPSIAPSVSGSSRAPSPSATARDSARPATSSPATGGFPGPGSTGVPAGTPLATYTGPCTITTDRAAVTGKIVKCDPFLIKARDVTIRRSRILGSLVTTEGTSFSFTLEDSEVDAGVYQGPAVGSTNMTIRRSEIRGGQANVLCYARCDIRDSWLHSPGLADGADWHLNGFLANDTDGSGRSDVVLMHNTIDCDTPANSAGGGCTADVSLFADFGPVSHVVVRDNLMGASPDIAYCLYGGSTPKEHSSGVRDIVVEDNVFQRGGNRKCGAYGPVTSFDDTRPGNSWKNNVWDDGSPVEAAN